MVISLHVGWGNKGERGGLGNKEKEQGEGGRAFPFSTCSVYSSKILSMPVHASPCQSMPVFTSTKFCLCHSVLRSPLHCARYERSVYSYLSCHLYFSWHFYAIFIWPRVAWPSPPGEGEGPGNARPFFISLFCTKCTVQRACKSARVRARILRAPDWSNVLTWLNDHRSALYSSNIMAGRTVFVRNLPFAATDDNLGDLFRSSGDITKAFVVKDKSHATKCRGFGYVTFVDREHAKNVVEEKFSLQGRPLDVTIAAKKPRKRSHEEEKEEESPEPKKHKKEKPSADASKTVVVTGFSSSIDRIKLTKQLEKLIKFVEIECQSHVAYVKFATHKLARKGVKLFDGVSFDGGELSATLQTREGKEISKATLKKSRLIVRNLSFQCEEDELRQKFEKHGSVLDVSIPLMKGGSGKRLGCAFIQYGSYFDAAKALQATNGVKIKGRIIAVDWAIPKTKYRDGLEQLESQKDEEKSEEEEEKEAGPPPKRFDRDDASQGRTVFIRGLPYNSTYDSVREVFSKYGDVRYCRLMMGLDTERCIGTGFVQFRTENGVRACLEASEITMETRLLTVTKAVTQSEAKEIESRDKSEGKERDKRNLYLAREGLITPSSTLAKDIPKPDMKKRLKAEAEKKAKLKNPDVFVSKTRLCVRNLPLNIDETKLKEVFAKVGGVAKSHIIQVKIMRSEERVDRSGLGRSRGYGFVQFREHEPALKALRATNNNLELFGSDRRLIVDFALENRKILEAREQRLKRYRREKVEGEKKRKRVPRKVMKSAAKKSKPEEEVVSPSTVKVSLKKMQGGEGRAKNLKGGGVAGKLGARGKHKAIGRKMTVKNRKSVKETKSEKSFSEIVEKHKSRLEHMDRSRWFE